MYETHDAGVEGETVEEHRAMARAGILAPSDFRKRFRVSLSST